MNKLFYALTQSLGLESNQQNGHTQGFEQLGRVVPDASRCVQCGVCVYNCPVGIPVRDYAHRELPVDDPNCIICGNCIQVCPRGTLRWETKMHNLIVERFPVATQATLEPSNETVEPS